MTAGNQPSGLIAFLRTRASGKVVLFLFILTTAVYLVMLLVTIPAVQGYAPHSALFDLSPAGYSHQEAMSLLESLGPEGRKAYLFPQLALDFVYPGLFAVCYSLMMTWAFSKRVRPASRFYYLALLPALAGIFDYAENVMIILMITGYPQISEELVTATSSFTLLKSTLTAASFLFLILGFAFLVKRRVRANPQVDTQSNSADQPGG